MLFLIIFTSTLLFLIYEFYWKRRNFPPGPMPVPLLGNMGQIMSAPAPGIAAFSEWTKKFGNIYTIWICTEPTVVITGYEELKKTFVDDGESYMDKFIYGGFNNSFRGGDFGVIDTNGDTWREHRRFALHTLRDFGLGKKRMEDSILLEIDKMEQKLELDGKDVFMQKHLDVAIGNVINQFLFGQRFDQETRFEELKGLIDQFFEAQASSRVYLSYFVPAMPKFITELMTPDIVQCREGLFGFYSEQIESHRKEIDYDVEENKDYVETYLKEQKKREALGDFQSFSNDQLKNMCFDMWIAGMHTTTNTLGFLISYAINNPECQAKMQKELTEVVGDRVVTMKDKLDLPYTNAFINESQRCCNLLPINLVHATTRDVELKGYTIKKGTSVLHQISSIFVDEKTFPEHEKFKPERFLDSAGKLAKIDELVPFSIGKRVCLGEGLARMELFLFTANLFNKFKFTNGSEGPPSKELTHAFISKVKDYKCNISPRYT